VSTQRTTGYKRANRQTLLAQISSWRVTLRNTSLRLHVISSCRFPFISLIASRCLCTFSASPLSRIHLFRLQSNPNVLTSCLHSLIMPTTVEAYVLFSGLNLLCSVGGATMSEKGNNGMQNELLVYVTKLF